MANLDESKRPERRRRTYFDVIANRGYFSAMAFTALFYILALLTHKGSVSVQAAVIAIVSFWGVSVAYFIFCLCKDFPRVYRFFVWRMRQYSRFAWIALFDINGVLVFGGAPTIYFAALGFNRTIVDDIESYSIRSLIAFYGASLVFSVIVMAIVVSHVARKRDVRCSKAPPAASSSGSSRQIGAV